MTTKTDTPTTPRDWPYQTTQAGCRFFRTGYEVGAWPVFVKHLGSGRWRAYKACHRALRDGDGKMIDADTPQALAERLADLYEAGAIHREANHDESDQD